VSTFGESFILNSGFCRNKWIGTGTIVEILKNIYAKKASLAKKYCFLCMIKNGSKHSFSRKRPIFSSNIGETCRNRDQ
jgi:hypothetical protein